jgi:hypothetical protein
MCILYALSLVDSIYHPASEGLALWDKLRVSGRGVSGWNALCTLSF